MGHYKWGVDPLSSHSFISFLSLLFPTNKILSSLSCSIFFSDGRCGWWQWSDAVVGQNQRAAPPRRSWKLLFFFNFFLVFHSISYPLLVSKLQILRKWTIHPRSKTESMKRKKLLPLLSLADPSVKVADWSWFLCFPRLFVRVCVFETIPVVLWLQVLMNWSLEFEICGLFVLVMLWFLVSGLWFLVVLQVLFIVQFRSPFYVSAGYNL